MMTNRTIDKKKNSFTLLLILKIHTKCAPSCVRSKNKDWGLVTDALEFPNS